MNTLTREPPACDLFVAMFTPIPRAALSAVGGLARLSAQGL